ncbi:MAG: HAD family hydrolase [Polyangiaceae bacterium]|jgi:HAD superfamily hydrolase (TIGR01549 family)
MNVAQTRPLTTIVFDVDGTLYRQNALRRAMLLKLLKAVASDPGSTLVTFRALRAYRRAQESLREAGPQGLLASAQLRVASEQSGLAEDVVAHVVARWMEREPLSLLEGFVQPGLRALLSAACSRGLRLGVVSDYPAEAKLKAMRLAEFFDVVVTAQDAAVNRFKPDPSGLVEALRRLGAKPDQALYVGDRYDVDGLAARAAGMACVIVAGRRNLKAWAPGRTSVSEVTDYRELHAMLFPSMNEAL